MITEQLVKKYPIISDQIEKRELVALLRCIEQIVQVHPAVSIVEFGCYVGTTSLFIRRLCDHYGFTGEFHVYDSFSGLPEKSTYDRSPMGEQFKTGELNESKKAFIQNFKKNNLMLPTIHKKWFSDLGSNEIPDGIGFAFLDGDYYKSIRSSLSLVLPRTTKGGVIIVDT